MSLADDTKTFCERLLEIEAGDVDAISSLQADIRERLERKYDGSMIEARTMSAEIRRKRTEEFYAQIYPKVQEARKLGYSTLRGIGAWLKTQELLPRDGDHWTPMMIKRIEDFGDGAAKEHANPA